MMTFATPVFAGVQDVINGLFQIYIGEEKISTPLYFSTTLYDKIGDKAVEMDGKIQSSKREDQFVGVKGKPLTYWFSEMSTCPEFPAGPGSDMILESNLYFNGIEKYEEVGMTPDGGLTTFKAIRRPGKGWTVSIDLEKLKVGARALQWYVKHKDNKRIYLIFIFRFVTSVAGTESGGIFIGLRIPPSDFCELPPEAKRKFILGMREADADCRDPQYVSQVRKQIGLKKIERQRGSVKVWGTPNASVQFSYIGVAPSTYRTTTLNEQGYVIFEKLSPQKMFKVRYFPNGQWIETPIPAGQEIHVTLPDRVSRTFLVQIENHSSRSYKVFDDILGPRSWGKWKVMEGQQIYIQELGRSVGPVNTNMTIIITPRGGLKIFKKER